MELRNYETVFILTPVLNKEQTDEATKKFHDFLVDQGVEILHEEAIGLKKLAYPIQHKSTGIYHLIEFKAAPTIVSVLETAYKRDEKVMRFLTFALDKHAVDYNDRKRKGTLTPHFKEQEA